MKKSLGRKLQKDEISLASSTVQNLLHRKRRRFCMIYKCKCCVRDNNLPFFLQRCLKTFNSFYHWRPWRIKREIGETRKNGNNRKINLSTWKKIKNCCSLARKSHFLLGFRSTIQTQMDFHFLVSSLYQEITFN